MIRDCEIAAIGTFGKTHGVNGEINLLVTADVDVEVLSCIVVDVDGINVPFFFKSVRPRGRESYLVSIDGVDSDIQASAFVNKEVSALKIELDDDHLEADDDGFYAEDLIGYEIESIGAGLKGEIIDVDDSTDNVLFVVRTDNGRQVLIPVADEFITSLDVDKHLVTMILPEGLVDL